MTLQLKCPRCNESLEAEEEWMGIEIQCPYCYGNVNVENPDQKYQEAAKRILSGQKSQEVKSRCPFCAEEILAAARKCKHCGEFLDGTQVRNNNATSFVSLADEPEKVLWTGTPSHLYYVGYYVFGVLLMGLYIGFILILWALLDKYSRVFTVTNKRVTAKSGIISRSIQEVAMKDIRNINFNQGVIERMFGLGTVQIGSAGTAGIEVQFYGIPDASAVKEMIARYKY